ncbi:MAG: bifunctional demethylmenaquinone methyltransferase/2-methoxy-6-polyprenyl-1,4-benzoquinol methylase UbiE [Bacteroidales bacterium]|nr:bifunctional demethylmenaquinone methyltransferase/2-methoxy-6-polyprenyl-1,4-benzoquinol methylase UbiE [Bacteroidales bacterium]
MNPKTHPKDKGTVEAMFNTIAPSYDRLNHLLSLNIDKRWRKLIGVKASKLRPANILDVATGTADLAIALARHTEADIRGIDISDGMLQIGKRKVEQHNLTRRIELLPADAASLPFDNHTFDLATIAFGVRNFEDTLLGLREIKRTIRNGGTIMVLEFSSPTGIAGWFARLYMRRVMPWVGKTLSGHPTAYTYLPETALTFPEGDAFCKILTEAGFANPVFTKLSFGIATLYEATVER